ncbi:MAG: hypothetical protein GXW99_11665 [Clostridiales bacterium]|nr:hypothetical protein [Clostridiales bacterium]
MDETLARLKKMRLTMMLVNLVYFLVLLSLGYLILIKGQGGVLYFLVAACLLVYLFGIRPLTACYKRAVREAILRDTVCQGLTNVTHEPKAGITAQAFTASGLMPGCTDKAFLSRERMTAQKGNYRAEMADVTFPIRENSLNAMFNGVYLCLRNENVNFPEFKVRAGETEASDLPAAAKKLLQEIADFIPGSLYLQTQGNAMHLLLRGRFIGFPINPLMNITEKTLQTNPLPELQQAVRLAQLLTMQQGTGQTERV